MRRFLVLLLMAAPAAAAPPTGSPDCTAERAAAGLPLPLGCANALNLRAMLDDPADLEAGRPLPPPQGEPATRPVERHRAGRTPDAPATRSGSDPP